MRTNNNRVTRPRTLGLPASPERAAMASAYETYATACRLAVDAHNAWRRLRHLKGLDKDGVWNRTRADGHPQVKAALTKAGKASMLRQDAKAQYRAAKAAAFLVGGRTSA